MISKNILCYDIANPKRLKRLYKTLLAYGVPIQYSIFYIEQDENIIDECWEKITKLINVNYDDVRLYPIKEFDFSEWNKIGINRVINCIQIQ